MFIYKVTTASILNSLKKQICFYLFISSLTKYIFILINYIYFCGTRHE